MGCSVGWAPIDAGEWLAQVTPMIPSVSATQGPSSLGAVQIFREAIARRWLVEWPRTAAEGDEWMKDDLNRIKKVIPAVQQVELEGLLKSVAGVDGGYKQVSERRGHVRFDWKDPFAQRRSVKKHLLTSTLNVEVEAHLSPSTTTGGLLLFDDLRRADKGLLPARLSKALAGLGGLVPLVFLRFVRQGRPQSLDEYWDVPGQLLSRSGRTLRTRMQGRDFMRWSPQKRASPFNAEFPHAIMRPEVGLVSRIEFNWFRAQKDIPKAVRWKWTPEYLLQANAKPQLSKLGLSAARMAVRVSTPRVKYGIGHYPVGGPVHDWFLINLDSVSAWGPDGGLLTPIPWMDVDVSSNKPIDGKEINKLATLTQALMNAYDLRPDPRTKAQKAIAALDMY